MSQTTTPVLSEAAETRRRELPVSLSLILLTGGLSAAIMDGAGAAVAWAVIMAVLLIADAELYRRLDIAERALKGRLAAGLGVWAFANATLFAALPTALWLDGAPAGAAAAMVLWVAGAVRCLGRGFSGMAPIALAGAAPPALSLLATPLIGALLSASPDWDTAVIAVIGGGALMAYVAHARLTAQRGRPASAGESSSNVLARLMFDTTEVAALLVGADGRVIATSTGMHKYVGTESEGRVFAEICPWNRDRWREAFAHAMNGERYLCEQDEVSTGHGAHHFRWRTHPWIGADGKVCGVIAYGGDGRQLAQAREEAAANDERLRVALAAGRSLVWEVNVQNNAMTWFGDPAPLYGDIKTFQDLSDLLTNQFDDAHRAYIMSSFDRCLKGELDSFEHKLPPDENGDVRWVEIHVRAKSQCGGVIGLTKDITARKRDEERFLAAMARAEEVLRAKRSIMMQAGAEPPPAPPPVVQQEWAAGIAEMFERLENLQDEMEARDALLAETLESLRATRAAAESASVSKSRYLANMSHELRTPLNAIIGYSEMLFEEAEADGRDADMADIKRVLSSARQLLHLINGILDLSKIEAGRMELSCNDFDAARLIEEAAATIAPSVEKNGNELVVEIEGALGEGHTDSFKLNQCLLNLLSNAAKFTREGRITLRARREERGSEGWLLIDVSDTGVGLTPEQISRLFSAFMQADASTAATYGGTGLGLTISRRIMHLLGGEIAVVSAPGKGSTFTLSLPMRAREGVALDREIAAPASGEGGQRLVLVVDDEESARELTERSLARLGFMVETAPNGAEGLALARAHKPSLIVLDINLPDMSGWDVLAALAEQGCDIPVLVHSVDDNRTRARAAGACELLVKPADRDVLAAAVLRFARGPENSSTIEPVRLTKSA